MTRYNEQALNDLRAEGARLVRDYRFKLLALEGRVALAKAELEKGRTSPHDGFNMGGEASDIQEMAARIDALKQALAWGEKEVE